MYLLVFLYSSPLLSWDPGGKKPPVEIEMEMPKKGFNQAAKWKDSATTLPAQQGPQVAASGINQTFQLQSHQRFLH